MADPSFNLKTGADSQLYYSREVTDVKSEDKDKLMSNDGVYKYPCLTRQTGNSIKGTTESIESNELRKGRTKSAPRKGNSSAEGSLDFELSPITYDDMFEAALRGKWTKWDGDYNSTNPALQETVRNSSRAFEAGDNCFYTKCANKVDSNTKFGKKKLFRYVSEKGTSGYDESTQSWGEGTDLDNGLFEIPNGAVIHELTCGTTDIKYTLLRQFGGVEGEDLYQKFDHCAVSTISNDISVGSIITGSVGFMGANDPKLLATEKIGAEFDKKGYDADPGTDTSMFVDGVTTGNSLIENLPATATQTDQFTAREGFLYLNGKNIEFANAMDWTLDNGLQKYFAIFVRNAIATTPLTLDITGNITTYLISGHSQDIFNAAVDDEDNEILWCIEDNEDNPKYLYIFQIFKSKFTDHDASVSGADVINVSFPFQSFGEQAIRIFRVTLPVEKATMRYDTDESKYEIVVQPTISLEEADLTNFGIAVSKGGAAVFVDSDSFSLNDDGSVTCVVTGDVAAKDELDVVVSYNSEEVWTGTLTAPAKA